MTSGALSNAAYYVSLRGPGAEMEGGGSQQQAQKQNVKIELPTFKCTLA